MHVLYQVTSVGLTVRLETDRIQSQRAVDPASQGVPSTKRLAKLVLTGFR